MAEKNLKLGRYKVHDEFQVPPSKGAQAMRRFPSAGRLVVVAVWAASVFVALAVSGAAEPKKEAGELDGAWKLVSVEREGQEMERDDDVRWVIQGGQVMYGGERLAAAVIYAAATPKGIDLSFHAPKNDYEGIYVLENDELKVCLNTRTTGAKERPSDFATKEKTNLRVLKFERMAPTADGAGTGRGYVGMALADETEAIVIQGVLENSPAEKAGLRMGDVVVSVGGEAVRDLLGTVDLVRRQMPGRDVAIRVKREGKEKDVTVRVAVFPFELLGILG
jgi:uncharacterized protein (TIGR03067 family)